MITGIILALIFSLIVWAIKADKKHKENPDKEGKSTADVTMAMVLIILISAGLLGFISGGKVF